MNLAQGEAVVGFVLAQVCEPAADGLGAPCGPEATTPTIGPGNVSVMVTFALCQELSERTRCTARGFCVDRRLFSATIEPSGRPATTPRADQVGVELDSGGQVPMVDRYPDEGAVPLGNDEQP